MWFENDYRRIFMDMHLNDTNEEYLSKLDVDEFVNCLKESGATSVVVKAKSHVGLHYWPSKFGKYHDVLKNRGLDYVGEMTKKCHENGINVIVYFSQIYDNYAYEHNKSWRLLNVAQLPSRVSIGKNKNRYGLVCPNNPQYQKYCEQILTELCENYDFEGFFLDMPFWPYPCYCKHCMSRFFKETGKMIPRIYNFDKKIWKQYIQARQRWIDEFIAHNTNVIKNINPNISVEHNMAAIGSNWINGNTEDNLKFSDYAGGDYYGGYLEQSFMCKYYNNVTKNKPFCYITSRCDKNLYFHTVSRTMQDLLIHSVNALVHNGAFSICDAMNPDGTFTKEMYSGAIKEVFSTTKPFEKYVSGDIQSDVAIWYNTNYKVNKNYIESPMNIARIMKEKNIAFDVVGSKNIKYLKSKVLCIADVMMITDQEANDIENYIINGGNVVITGTISNSEKLQKLVGVRVDRISKYNYCYIEPKAEFASLMKTFDFQSPYPIEHSALEVSVIDNDVQVMATIDYPYTLRSEKDFAAIHSDPPGIHTQLPGITKVKRGKGTIIWAAAPLELTKAHHCRQSIADIICSFIDENEREFVSNAPDFVEIVKWVKDGKTFLSLINQQEVTPVYPVNGIKIVLNNKFSQAKLLSDDKTDLKAKFEIKKTEINISNLNVFCMIELE